MLRIVSVFLLVLTTTLFSMEAAAADCQIPKSMEQTESSKTTEPTTQSVGCDDGTPSTPSSISAPANSGTGNYSVSWSYSTGGSGTIRYFLEESVNGGAYNAVTNLTGTNFTITGRSESTYRYRVKACGSAGYICSSYRTASNDTVVKVPPTLVPVFTNANTANSYSTIGEINLTWNTVSKASEYKIERYLGYTWTVQGSSNYLSFYVSNLTVGANTFRIKACNAGGCTAWSNNFVVTLTQLANITGASQQRNNISLTVIGGEGSASRVKIDGSLKPHSQTRAITADLSLGHHQIEAASCKAEYIGTSETPTYTCSGFGKPFALEVVAKPGTPSSISRSGNTNFDGTPHLSWGAASGLVHQYELYSKLNTNPLSLIYSGTALNYTLSDATNGNYQFFVRACNTLNGNKDCSPYRTTSNEVVKNLGQIIPEWDLEKYSVYSGNFNANPGNEVLALGKRTIIMLHGDIITPIVIFPKINNAIVSWNASGIASYTEFKFDANPADYVVHIGSLNNDDHAEIFLQAKSKGSTSYLLSNTGALIQTINNGFLNMDWSAASTTVSIANNKIHLVSLANGEINDANHNSLGSITSLVNPITKPAISGQNKKYAFEGILYSFAPLVTNTNAARLIFTAPNRPNWLKLDTETGVLSGTPEMSDTNKSHTITITVTEDKTHRIPVSMTIDLTVVNRSQIVQTDYTIYRSADGTLYLKFTNGDEVYKIVEDVNEKIIIKLASIDEFNASGATLFSGYQIQFTDRDFDGHTDLVLVAANNSGLETILISYIDAMVHPITNPDLPLRNDLVHSPLTLPAAVTNPLDGLDTGTVVGSLPAEFSVKPSGSASYEVPITVAPGSGGLVPNIKIAYDSLAGNGVLGVGWGIDGISSIKNCSVEQNGPHKTVYGKFCLNGKKLVQGNNSNHYKTEDKTSINIIKGTFTGGVEYTEYKIDGSKNIYREIRTGYYPIYRQVDASGNYIEMVYDRDRFFDSDNFKLLKVLYTGNEITGTSPYNSIVFQYEGRSDYFYRTLHGFTGAISARVNKIISKVNTDADGENGDELRTYTLRYGEYSDVSGRSLLRGIKACRATSCLPETTFDWQEGSQTFADVYTFSNGSRYDNGKYGHPWGYLFLDFDGDGIIDYWKNKNDSGDDPSDDLIVLKGGDTFQELEIRDDFLNRTMRNSMQLIDYNLDGKDDVIYAANGYWHIIMAKKMSETRYHDFDNPINTGIPYHTNELLGVKNLTVTVADYNGDFYPDISFIHKGRIWTRLNLKVSDVYASAGQNLFGPASYFIPPTFPTEDQFSNSCPDIDNCSDYAEFLNWNYGEYSVRRLAMVYANYKSWFKTVSNGPGKLPSYLTAIPDWESPEPVAKGSWYGNLDHNGVNEYGQLTNVGSWGVYGQWDRTAKNYDMYDIFTPDLNNDGIDDIFYVKAVNGEMTLFHCFRSNTNICDATSSAITLKDFAVNNDDLDNLSFHFADYNHDGLKDLIHGSRHNKNLYVRYNKRSHFAESELIPVASVTAKIEQMMDVNGDGVIDYAYHEGRLHHQLGTSQKHDLIEGINDGSTLKRQIKYSSELHTPDNDARSMSWPNGGPVHDIGLKTYLVSSTFKRSTMTNEEIEYCDIQINERNGEPDCYDTFANTYSGTGFSEWLSFEYKGLKSQLGRGLLGFREVIVTDHINDKKVTTEYRRDFPYTGLMLSTETVTGKSGNQLIETIDVEYAKNNDGLVFAKKTTTAKSENGISFSTQVITTPNVDQFGLPAAPVTTVLNDLINNITFTTTETYKFTLQSEHYGGRLTNKTTTFARDDENAITQKSSYEYFPSGLLWKQTVDPTSNPGSSLADPTDQVYGLTTVYERDDYGNIISTTSEGSDELERKTVVTFDSRHRYPEQSFVYPNYPSLDGVIQTSNEYDNIFGTKISETSANGQVTRFGYSQLGRLNFENSANGSYTTTNKTFCNDALDCPENALYRETINASHGPNSIVYFDKRGQKIKEKTESLSCYNPQGIDNVCADIVTQWVNKTYIYNDKGQKIYESRPHFDDELSEIDYSANNSGNIITTVPKGYASFKYDYQGRPTHEYKFDRSLWRTSYSGYTATITDPFNRKTAKVVNGLGELIKMTDADDNVVSYAYDALGSLRLVSRQHSTISGGSGSIDTVIANDHLGRKTAMSDPDKGTVEYRYNSFGELIWQQDNKQQVSIIVYDSIGRVIENKAYTNYANLAYDHHTKSYYDLAENGLGLLQREEDLVNGITHSFNYNIMSQVTTEVSTFSSGQRFYSDVVYDNLFRVKETYDASSAAAGIQYTYYNNYLVTKTDLRSGTVLWQYLESDSIGNTTAYKNGNGLVNTKNYDRNQGTLEFITTVKGPSTALQHDVFIFNSIGNLNSREDVVAGMTETFNYDNINRLDDWSINFLNQNTLYDINYDHLGNISDKAAMGSYLYGQTQCGRKAGPHAVTTLTTATGNENYCYDANGNMVSGGGRSSIRYNTNDKPTYIKTTKNDVIEYKYGLGGSRFKRIDTSSDNKVKTTLYVGNVEFISEEGKLTKVLRHMEGVALETYIPKTGDRKLEFLHRDHLGSVELVTDQNGNMVNKFSYDPWGQRRDVTSYTQIGIRDTIDLALSFAVTDFKRGYTGHEHIDEAGLIHMNGRVYDPRLGRFLSADPFVKTTENLQSFNRYSYVSNNPLNAVDPSGYTDIFIGISFGSDGAGFEFSYSNDNTSWEYSSSNNYESMNNTEDKDLNFGDGGKVESALNRTSWFVGTEVDGIDSNQSAPNVRSVSEIENDPNSVLNLDINKWYNEITGNPSAPWMETALGEIGQAEVNGVAANPRILEYSRSSSKQSWAWMKDDSGGKNAWCANFVSWVMKKHGYELPNYAMRAKSWSDFGQKINSPIYGAIGIKNRSGGGHVAFVVGQSSDGKHVYMLGGNQGDMVQISKYPVGIWNFVVPTGYNTNGRTLPLYSKSAQNAGRED